MIPIETCGAKVYPDPPSDIETVDIPPVPETIAVAATPVFIVLSTINTL